MQNTIHFLFKSLTPDFFRHLIDEKRNGQNMIYTRIFRKQAEPDLKGRHSGLKNIFHSFYLGTKCQYKYRIGKRENNKLSTPW